MSTSMGMLSMLGSALSFLWTGYFWLVKVRRERPKLQPYLADHDMFLGAMIGESRQVGIKLGLIVANYSSLPNALLGVRLWLRQRDRKWLEVESASFDKETPMPFNVPAMQTALIRITGRLSFPVTDELEGTASAAVEYVKRYLADPCRIGVELQGLGSYIATAELEM